MVLPSSSLLAIEAVYDGPQFSDHHPETPPSIRRPCRSMNQLQHLVMSATKASNLVPDRKDPLDH